MNSSLAATMRFGKTGSGSATYLERALGPSPAGAVSAVINQPLEKVLAALKDDGHDGHAVMEGTDPTLCRSNTILGRRVEIHHTLYEIPGGTQVIAEADVASGEVHDLVTALAVRAAGRQFAGDLARLKARME